MDMDEIAIFGVIIVIVGAALVTRVAARENQSTQRTVLAIGGVLVVVLVGLLFLVLLHLFSSALATSKEVLDSSLPRLSAAASIDIPAPRPTPSRNTASSSATSKSKDETKTVAARLDQTKAQGEAKAHAMATRLDQMAAKIQAKAEAIASEVEHQKSERDASASHSPETKSPPQETKRSTPIGPTPSPTPGKRPDWVDSPPGRMGDGLGVYQMSVSVGPYTTQFECENELPAQLARKLDEYVDLYLGPEARGRIPFDFHTAIGPKRTSLEELIVRDTFNEEIQTSLGPMKQMHVRIELSSAFNDWLKSQWREVQSHRRIWYAGAGLSAVLGMLSVVFFSSKIDLATGGRHRARLGVAAALLVLLLTAVVWLATSF